MSNKQLIKLLFLIFFISMVFGGVHLTLWLKLKDNYSPITINSHTPSFISDETIAYAPKVREILDGNYILTDVYLKEYKNLPSPLVSENLPALLMALLAKFSGTIPRAFIIADFIFPPIIFFILTCFIYTICKNFFFSSFASLMIIFFSKYFEYLPYIPSIIHLITKAAISGTYSDFYRSFHPQISSPVFIWFIFYTFLAWQKNRFRYWLGSGILLGLLSYTYVILSSYAFCLMFIFFLFSIAGEKIYLTKKVLFSTFCGLLISLPYLVNLFYFNRLPQAKNYILNFQYPAIIPWKILIITILFFLLSNLLKPKKVAIFFRNFFLTGISLLMLTFIFKLNINDSPGHWAIRVIFPFSFLVVLLLFRQYLFKKINSLFWFVACLVILIYNFYCHQLYFANQRDVFSISKEEREITNWLTSLTKKDSVVLTASLKHNLLIPALTHNNVFLPYSQYSLASEQEALERFFILYKFLDIEPARIKEMFSKTNKNEDLAKIKRFSYDDCAGAYFYFLRFKKKHNYFCDIPQEKITKIINSYQDFNFDFKHHFLKYKADYLLIGPYEKKWARLNLQKLSFLKLIKQNKNYQLYQIKI